MITTDCLSWSSTRARLAAAALLACILPFASAQAGEGSAKPATGVMSVIIGSKDFNIREGLPQNFSEAKMVMNMVGAMSARESKNGKPDMTLVKRAAKYYKDMANDPRFKDLPSALSPALSGHTRPPCHYFLFVPEKYASAPADRKWPMLIVLHGAGGNMKVGFPAITKVAEDRGYILVSPSYRADGAWWKPDAREFLVKVVEDVCAKYRVDRDRVAIAGVSNGAAGAWVAAKIKPELYRAVISISGMFEGRPEPTPSEGPPVFIVHGARDGVIPVTFSRNAFKAFEKVRPGTEYKEYPRDGHLVFFTKLDEVLGLAFDWLGKNMKPVAKENKK